MARFPTSGRVASRLPRPQAPQRPVQSTTGNHGRSPKDRRSDEDRCRFRVVGSPGRADCRDVGASRREQPRRPAVRCDRLCRACRPTCFRPAWISGFACPAALKAARTILIGFIRVKEQGLPHKHLIAGEKGPISDLKQCHALYHPKSTKGSGSAHEDVVLRSGLPAVTEGNPSCASSCSSSPQYSLVQRFPRRRRL